MSDRTLPTDVEVVTHFAPTAKKFNQRDVMCGYVGPNDVVSMDSAACTCTECLDWIRPPELRSERLKV